MRIMIFSLQNFHLHIVTLFPALDYVSSGVHIFNIVPSPVANMTSCICAKAVSSPSKVGKKKDGDTKISWMLTSEAAQCAAKNQEFLMIHEILLQAFG